MVSCAQPFESLQERFIPGLESFEYNYGDSHCQKQAYQVWSYLNLW